MGGGGDRRGSGGYGSSQLSSDPYSSMAGNDQYYSSFADSCKDPMLLSPYFPKALFSSFFLLPSPVLLLEAV